MPTRVYVRTAKKGLTAADRRVLSGVSAVTAEPTATDDGVLLEGLESVHLLFTLEGGTAPEFVVQLWYYSTISGRWHRGESLVVASGDVVTVESLGLERLALQVASVSDATAVLSAWVAQVVPV